MCVCMCVCVLCAYTCFDVCRRVWHACVFGVCAVCTCVCVLSEEVHYAGCVYIHTYIQYIQSVGVIQCVHVYMCNVA